MTTLQHPLAAVQPDHARIAIVGLPETLDHAFSAEPEPFHPSREDEAFDLGYRLARDGEGPAKLPAGGTSFDVSMRFLAGQHAGRIARESAEAREIGRTLGYSGSGICEPPPGFAAHERAAYRGGFAAGEAEFAADREYDAFLDSIEAERMEDAFGYDVMTTDADVWPLGCAS